MKRFLSLTIVAIMLLSTLMLTSCDFIDQTKDYVHGLIGIEKEEEKEVITTITAAEWKKLSSFDQYTLDFDIILDGVNVAVILDHTPKAEKIIMKYNASGTNLQITYYYDGKAGYAIEQNNGWQGYESESFSKQFAPFVAEIQKIKFYDLTYDEHSKAYIYNESTGDLYVYFYFENGSLVRIEGSMLYGGMDITFIITNIGNVTVELPKYFVLGGLE